MPLCRLALILFLFSSMPAIAGVEVPSATPQAVAYQHGNDLFWVCDQIAALLTSALFLCTGWGATLRTVLDGWTRGRRLWTVTAFAAAFVIIGALLALPLRVCEGYIHEHAYGLSTESLGHWLGQQATGLGVATVMTCFLAWIPYLLLARRPRDWWLWATATCLPVFVLMQIVAPLWILPLFNSFSPMPNTAMEAKLRAEAAGVGLGDAPIFVMDQSTTSKAPGAFVTGVFGASRIVLFDTLLDQMDERQVKFVLGHEMKHYLLNDAWKFCGIFTVIACICFFLIDRFGRATLRRWGILFGFNELSDPASLPLLFALFTVIMIGVTPVINLISTDIEHEADRFGLEVTRDNEAAATAFVKLQQGALRTPDPSWFARIFRQDHPALRDRITFANDYHPWTEGQPLKYGKWIHQGDVEK